MQGVGVERVDGAGERQGDGGDAAVIAQAAQPADAGVQLLDVDPVAGRREAADHCRRLGYGHLGLGDVRLGRGALQHLVVRGAGVAQEEDLLAVDGDAGDLVGRQGDLAPGRLAVRGRRHVGHIKSQLVLHAGDHRRDGQRRSGRRLDDREVDVGHADHGAGALPQHLGVAGRIGVQPVEPGRAVLVLVGAVVGDAGLQAVVEEARPVFAPARAGVLGAVDGLGQQFAGLGDQDAGGRLLGAARRGPEHDVRAVRRRGPPVERGMRALGGVGVRIQQHPVLAVHALAHIELERLGVGGPDLGEDVVAAHLHGADRDNRAGIVRDLGGQGVAAGDRVQHRLGVGGLTLGVGLPLRPFGLHPAIGVGDLGPEQVFGDGFHRRDGRAPRRRLGQGQRRGAQGCGKGRRRPQEGPAIDRLVHA